MIAGRRDPAWILRARAGVLVVQHPIGTVKQEEVDKRADAAFAKLVDILLEPQARRASAAG